MNLDDEENLNMVRIDDTYVWVDEHNRYWFSDETEGLHGPYKTYKEADDALTAHCKEYLDP